ncbi:MAG: transglutaminase [Sphingomonadales bacterium 32-64-17]|nr:MAG: transglutaminase [Sphingomonadales bacterium 32-64-17]
MPLSISAHFGFTLWQPTDVLLQFEAAPLLEQKLLTSDTWIPKAMHTARVPAQDNIGDRFWIHAEGECRVDYTATVEVMRQIAELELMGRVPPRLLPGEAVKYLFDSRYCQASSLFDLVGSEFAGLEGGAKVAAMRDWVAQNIAYTPGSSDASTTALDTIDAKAGICRDFAHVLVSLARAAAIPARYVSCFAPGVTPQDFHAIAEVFLADPETPQGGTWQLVDATGMAEPAQTAKIGVGRDAADVSFMTVFGAAQFDFSEVAVEEISG